MAIRLLCRSGLAVLAVLALAACQGDLTDPEGLSGNEPILTDKGTPGPPDGKGPGDENPNNLSVPTIMIGGSFTGVTCPNAAAVYPTGTPINGFEIDPAAYYYVQGTHTWQAECDVATSATATAEWGDNLGGDAKLQVGQPIRVELGLFDDTGLQMEGFSVVKLEPSELDREAAYGTLASTDDGGLTFYATAQTLPARVFDSGVTFSVQNVGTGMFEVPAGTNPTAEINATGKVVYGYNLRVPEVGQYAITFEIPNVDITGVDVGTYTTLPDGPDTVTLLIDVIGGGGGGGGGAP